ncbi:MAG: Ig-like domain repeat protein [Dehalococcoidia bacterium]|nr:Ig-like domain repeat protein [Dehalococcoidia bacterium]
MTKRTRRILRATSMLGLSLLLALAFVVLVNTSAPMPALAIGAVAPLDAWPATPQMAGTTGNPTNYDFAISDGIDRLLVVLVCGYDSGSTSGQTFTATYGGKTLTQAFLQNSNHYQTWIGYLKENDIATRSGNSVAVTVAGTHTQVRAYIASYSGVDQAAPVTASGGTYVNNTNGVTIGGPLTVNAGGYGIYGWSSYAVRTRTSDDEGYSELSDVDNALNPNYGVAVKSFATAGTTNPTVTWSGANYASVSFITLNPDSAYPLPTTTSISPASKIVGDAGFTLTVNGTNFVNGASVVRLDGSDRATVFVNSTQLTATIPASDLTTGGDKSITVFTSAPGGGISNAQTLTVNKMTPTITWDNPADIVYGTALSSTQLSANASVPGDFVYTPDFGAMLLAGNNQTLHVDFTPTDTANYSNASKEVSINVDRAVPIITWDNPADIVYGTALSSTQLCATTSVPGSFVYSPGLGGLLLAGDGQTLHVDFTPTDTANYVNASTDVTINVSKAALIITANSLNKVYGNAVAFAGIEFTAAGLVNGDTVDGVTLTSVGASGGATVDGSPYAVVPSAAFGWGLSNYDISYVNGSLTVNKASISLSLISSVGESTRGRSVTFTATASDTGATGTVTFQDGETVLGSSTLLDGIATFTTSTLPAGSRSIAAVYSGNANFAGSTSSAIDLSVGPAAGFNWALIGWIVAAMAVVLLLLLVVLLRRRKRAPRTDTISRAMGVVFDDNVTTNIALSTVEEVSTYPIQLERELERSIKRVEKSMEGAIQAICRTVESKDPYVAAHQKRVSQFACTIAKEMGLTDWQIDGVRVAGLLHDIGKVTVPTEILTKPGRLSKIEMAMIKDHPKVAFDILKNVEFDWPVARMVVQHHERMDGSGYPDGIKGEDILLEARILAVADVVEAMCTNRPYRPALDVDEALAELARGDGTLYDPEVVRACKKVLIERGFKVEFASTRA